VVALIKPIEVEEFVDRFVHRPLAARLIPLLVRTPITPNQVTLLSGAIGIFAGVALAWGADCPHARLASGILLFVAVVLDCCDGQLARARGTSSTSGAVLDGIADYAVGIAYGAGAAFVLAHHSGSGWYWLLGLAGMASMAIQLAAFDHAKTRYTAQVAGGYAEREEDLEQLARERAAARAAGRRAEVFLLWLYERYTRVQQAAVKIGPVRDAEAHRAANRGRMYAWTLLGSGTRFAMAYLLAALSAAWMPALTAFFAINLTLGNLYAAVLLALEKRQHSRVTG
jgi:phosphatidylglycerophosphate synthase